MKRAYELLGELTCKAIARFVDDCGSSDGATFDKKDVKCDQILNDIVAQRRTVGDQKWKHSEILTEAMKFRGWPRSGPDSSSQAVKEWAFRNSSLIQTLDEDGILIYRVRSKVIGSDKEEKKSALALLKEKMEEQNSGAAISWEAVTIAPPTSNSSESEPSEMAPSVPLDDNIKKLLKKRRKED